MRSLDKFKVDSQSNNGDDVKRGCGCKSENYKKSASDSDRKKPSNHSKDCKID